MPALIALPAPLDHFPAASGRYEVKAGLSRLAGPAFMADDRYLAAIAAKRASAAHRQVYLTADLTPALVTAALRYVLDALPATAPAVFQVGLAGDRATFTNHVLGLEATIDLLGGQVLAAEGPGWEAWQGRAALDFLAMQTQEDWALVAADPADGREWLAMTHVCFPNHWAAEEKIGRSFAAVHEPIPGAAPMIRASAAMVDMMIRQGPWERAVWDLRPDDILDHHPALVSDEPPRFDAATWVFRSERQSLVGFPAADGALFTIRTYVQPLATLTQDPKRAAALHQAVAGMPDASRRYKGLDLGLAEILAYLAEKAGA